jgi:hypothetical protein
VHSREPLEAEQCERVAAVPIRIWKAEMPWAKSNLIKQRRGEDLVGGVLECYRHGCCEGRNRSVPRVDAIDKNTAGSGLQHPIQQTEESAFAGAVMAGDEEEVSGRNLERDLVQHRRPVGV